MRYIVLAAMGALAATSIGTAPANAYWQCQGPEVACSGSGASAAKAKSVASKARTARHVAKSERVATRHKTRHERVASRSRAVERSVDTGASYGGGSVGIASYYGASGMTAAHRTLPFGTRVLVTHLGTGRQVTVTINDRGPFIKGRIIDLSTSAAGALGIRSSGLAKVSVAVVGKG